jgi:hypothetical protein
MNKTCSTVFISFAVFPRKIRVDATSFRITLMRRVRKVGSRILLKFEKKIFLRRIVASGVYKFARTTSCPIKPSHKF